MVLRTSGSMKSASLSPSCEHAGAGTALDTSAQHTGCSVHGLAMLRDVHALTLPATLLTTSDTISSFSSSSSAADKDYKAHMETLVNSSDAQGAQA